MERGQTPEILRLALNSVFASFLCPFFMVYGAESVLPCNIIHDSTRVCMYKDKEAELDRQDNLDALEEERDIAKARSAFYQQQAHGTKAEKCGPKLIILANMFYA